MDLGLIHELQNSLSPFFALQHHVLDSAWSHTRAAHSLPYFMNSKVLDHNV